MRWFVAILILLFIALTFNLGLLAYAIYALVGVFVVSRLLTQVWVKELTATRECNRLQAEVGDSVAVMVTVENNSALPVPWVLLEDLLPRSALLFSPPNLEATGSRMKLAMLKPRGKSVINYQLKCNRRGYYQLGPLVLETGDLFGLHRRYRVAAEPHFLLVLPKVTPLEGFDIASKRPIGEVRMTYRLFEDPTRISGVRSYEAGDPLNRIHWRATARTGLLQSKIYEPSTVAGATLLLDFHKQSHNPRNEPVRSELAINATASIANAVYEMGQQIGLVTNGRDAADRIRQEGWAHDYRSREEARKSAAMLTQSDRLQPVVVPTRRGAEQWMRIMETLARLELTDGLDLSHLVEESSARLPRDATVIAILPQATADTAILLGNMVRRGFAVAAILNIYEDVEFADAAGLLMAQGIDAHHLKDEASISEVCRRYVLR